MTVLNCWLSAKEAHVAVDTEATRRDGSRMVCSKFLPIPHLCAGIGLRGQSVFQDMLYAKCSAEGFETFDALLEGIPAILAEIEGYGFHLDAVHGEGGYEVLAVGWSDARQRMAARHYVKRSGQELVRDVDDMLISPWHSSLSNVSTKLANAERLATAQAQWMRQFGFAGGRLLLFRLTRDSIKLTSSTLQLLEAAA